MSMTKGVSFTRTKRTGIQTNKKVIVRNDSSIVEATVGHDAPGPGSY